MMNMGKYEDPIILPRSLLGLGARAVWVYAQLTALADSAGCATIKVNSWCRAIGLSRQRLRGVLSDLVSAELITTEATRQLTRVCLCEFEPGKSRKRKYCANKPPKDNVKKEAPQQLSIFKTADELPLGDPAFAEIFKRWLDYKKNELSDGYKTISTMRTAYNRLVKLSGGSPEKAVAIVEQSIAQRWKGLFELKKNGNEYEPCGADCRKGNRYSELEDAARFVLRNS